jgi:acyl-coenzyme A synthetase/AMP-(fatty) acid ligase
MNAIALVVRPLSEAFARVGGQTISVGEFCGDVINVADSLPEAQHIINLCQDRYTFTVTFFAALANGQTNLLPAKRDPSDARALSQQYDHAVVVTDAREHDADWHVQFTPGANGNRSAPLCEPEHIAAIAFTSGSTGAPQAHPKSWRMLDTWRQVHHRHLPGQQQHYGLVATVPSWHMYGLEWAMLLPTIAPLTIHCGADFYPHDVIQALAEFSAGGDTVPTVLVSTPVHLRALVKATNAPLSIRTVLCATAPLDNTLTSNVEAHFDTQILEIYGCSEIGSLAFRFPNRCQDWTFFDCFDLTFDEPSITVSHPLLPEAITLADAFSRNDNATYELLGRTTDIIKVGGKRESLANLNNILNALSGVEDGVIYQPQTLGLPETGRLAALVVAPTMDVAAIRAGLAEHMDATFLPRPIRKVAQLPRDTTSKLKLADLTRLAQQQGQNQ